jgi:hypothetical protein
MTAGLQRQVDSASGRERGSALQSLDLRMSIAGTTMPALAYNLSFPDDDTADAWIGICRVFAALRQGECSRHMMVINRIEHDPSIPITQQ